MTKPELVATCWTSAGDAAPMRRSEASPFDAFDRVRVAADEGWVGVGFVLDDLKRVRDTVGYEQLAAAIDRAGLTHVEVELCSGWWRTDDDEWRNDWRLLLEAADRLGASFIKIGTEQAPPARDLGTLVEPLRSLAREATDHGTRVALEPLPFGAIESVPRGTELVRMVNHRAAGLIVDFWHVFRAGTTLRELRDCLSPEIVFGVELCDADAEPTGTLFEDTRDNRRLIGHGAQDVQGFIRTMRTVGFEGPWGIEILSAEHRRRTLHDALRIARETAQSGFGSD